MTKLVQSLLFCLISAMTIGMAQAQAPAAQAPTKSKAPAASAPASAPAAASASASAKSGELVDINTASEKELAELPKIGEARAKAIVKGRPYSGKDDLLRKKIIPKDAYAAIKDKVIAKQDKSKSDGAKADGKKPADKMATDKKK
jgi:competence protein ComEA